MPKWVLALEPGTRARILERTRIILTRNLGITRDWLDSHSDLFDYRAPDAGAICWLRYRSEVNSSEFAELRFRCELRPEKNDQPIRPELGHQVQEQAADEDTLSAEFAGFEREDLQSESQRRPFRVGLGSISSILSADRRPAECRPPCYSRTAMHKTPLNDFHRERGARLVEFAGWEMPVVYTGIKEEHAYTREHCSLFDISHMGRIEVLGDGAEAFLQRVCTRNVGGMKVGLSRYTHICREDGGILDDVIVSRLATAQPMSRMC